MGVSMKYLMTFHTHAGAICFERKLRAVGESCELMPVPRKLSSSCGVCAKFDYDAYITLIDTDVDKVFSINGHDYNLLFENE